MDTEAYCGKTSFELHREHHKRIRAAVRARKAHNDRMAAAKPERALAGPSGRLLTAFVGGARVYHDKNGITLPFVSILGGEA